MEVNKLKLFYSEVTNTLRILYPDGLVEMNVGLADPNYWSESAFTGYDYENSLELLNDPIYDFEYIGEI
jgi:hypothetical protein